VHRFRSLAIAIVVLALSAGAVFASKSISDAANASNTGLARAHGASGLTLPANTSPDQVAPTSVDPTTGTSDPTTGTSDPTTGTSDPTTGTSDPTTGTTRPIDTHGAVVSTVAHLSLAELQALCPGFDGKNKGAFISAIARGLLVVTVGVVQDPTSGTSSIVAQTCSPGDASAGTTMIEGVAPVPTPGPTPGAPGTTAPTKLHGQANAAAKRAAHQPGR
jgi:hypothetical protein